MKCWMKLWKLRRQDDRVKIVFLLFLTGFGFCINVVYNGISLYKMLYRPFEYIIEGTNDSLADSKLAELGKQKNVFAVSRQNEFDVIFNSRENELTVPCVELSASYIEDVYNIKEKKAMITFYVNKKGYNQLCKELKIENNKYKELKLNCIINKNGDTKEDFTEKECTARIIVIENNLSNDKASFVYVGDNFNIHKSKKARVCVSYKDIERIFINNIEKLGLHIDNIDNINKTEYMQKILLNRILYGIIVFVICFFSTYMLCKFTKCMRSLST